MIEEIKAGKKHCYKEMHEIADKLTEWGFEYNIYTNTFTKGNIKIIIEPYRICGFVGTAKSDIRFAIHPIDFIIEKLKEHIQFANGA